MIFDLTSCRLSLRDEDGFVKCQPDPYGSEGTSANHEAFLPFGLGGRPKAPSTGIGAHLFVMRHGDDTFVLPGHDPRWMSARPDFGDGGASLCACTGTASSPKAPYLAFFGEGAEAGEAEGLFRIHVPAGSGQTRFEVNPSAGDVTLSHAGGGTSITMTSTEIKAGDSGAKALATLDLVTWITSTLIPALAAAPGGPITVAPPANATTTKFKAT